MSAEQSLETAYSALKAGNYAVALRESSALAEDGSSTAWMYLGWMHEHAAGTREDFSKAEECYKKAISIGDSGAKFLLARMMWGLNRYKDAFVYFLAAADEGHLSSTYWTGRCYLKGYGVEKDMHMAELYLKRAADQGHLYARRDYSRGRMRGAFGKREFVRGLVGWISVPFAMFKAMKADRNSELMH